MVTRERTRAGGTMWPLLPLLLLIVPGCVSIRGPQSVNGSSGDSVTIQCRYDSGWEAYKKWWCRGEAWGSCEILIKTNGSEQKVQSGRVSVQDNHSQYMFTVTMEELQGLDEDMYWCGIERSGTDLGHQVHVSVGPAKPAWTYMADLASPSPTVPVTTDTADPVETPAEASVAPSPPLSNSSDSSVALSSSLTRSLLCNLHFVLVTFIKVPLLMGLLCRVMWLGRPQGPSGRKAV